MSNPKSTATDLKTTLKDSLDEAAWDWLIPHVKRNAVIVVSEPLELLDVGVAIANDDAVLVQNWISRKLIQKPSSEQLSQWNNNPSKRFQTIIVQPYVAIKEFPDPEDATTAKV